jgi:hypothetical protein
VRPHDAQAGDIVIERVEWGGLFDDADGFVILGKYRLGVALSPTSEIASWTKSGSSSASNSAPLPIAATGPIKSWQSRAASISSTRRSTAWSITACWHGGETAATPEPS